MARTRTAEELVLDCRKRAGMEFSQLLEDPEILEIFNQEYAELRAHIRLNEGQEHDALRATLAVVAGTSLYTLPTDFWEILALEASINGRNIRLEPFMRAERAGLSNTVLLGAVGLPLYRLFGKTQIEFLPATRTFTATLTYAPATPRLKLGQVPPDTVDGYNGYEMAAIYGTVAVMQAKEESDPSFYEGRKVRIYQLIEAQAAQRDASSPERVTDVTGGLDDALFPGRRW